MKKWFELCFFCVTRLDFLNHTLKALNIPFKKVVLPGRVKCDGTEGEIVVAHGCRKRKKLICGTEGEIAVAHGRLPSPAHITVLGDEFWKYLKGEFVFYITVKIHDSFIVCRITFSQEDAHLQSFTEQQNLPIHLYFESVLHIWCLYCMKMP